MNEIKIPEFASYDEEAEFWDNLDTADLITDGDWFRLETDNKRAIRIAILPEIAEKLADIASSQQVSLETFINSVLAERAHQPV